jgi:hypothetical protein
MLRKESKSGRDAGELESALQRAEEESWSAPLSGSDNGQGISENGANNDGMGYSMQGREDRAKNGRPAKDPKTAKSARKK